MASVKLAWGPVWEILWRAIPDPLTDGRLLLAVDDSINPKTGRKVFACQETFDHAAKTNQSQFVWAQTIVTVGLLKIIHGRWCCLPLAFAFYFRYQTLHTHCVRVRGEPQVFQTKFAQVVALIVRLGGVFTAVPVLVVCDSWFGNNGLLKPLRQQFGTRAHLLSRLRSNAALYELPTPTPGRPGRPRKYGARAGTASQLATTLHTQAQCYTLHLYGRMREVVAVERLVMLKTLRCPVRVVWVFRRTQWVALVTTDLTLSLAQIVEYYGARWKIEAGFREIKQEIGSAETQTRNPDAVTNHLNFCMAATAITWIYGEQLAKAPPRRYATTKRTEYAFADLRRRLAQDLGGEGFGIDCADPGKPVQNRLLAAVMALAA
jgi:hypothetical protein